MELVTTTEKFKVGPLLIEKTVILRHFSDLMTKGTIFTIMLPLTLMPLWEKVMKKSCLCV